MEFLSSLDTRLVALFGAVVLYVFWRSRLSPLHSLPYPPGPPAPGWLSGHLSILPVAQQWKVYTEWAKKYGSVMHIRTYGQHTIILSSFEDCVEAFERRSNLYSDKPPLTIIELMEWDWNASLMPYGSRWRELRRHFQQSFKRVASATYRPEQTRKINDMLYGLLTNPEHFFEHVKTVTGGIALSIAYGYDVKPKNDYLVDLSEDAVSRLCLAVMPGVTLVNAIPILRHLPAWFPGAGFHKLASDTKEMTTKIRELPLQYVKKNMEAGSHLNCLVAERLPSCETDQDIKVLQEFAALVYIAGADTTMSALQTFFYAITISPSVQEKAQKELDAVVGSARLPDYDDWKSLPYIEAIMREVLRWRPVTPLGVAHSISDDDVFKGYLIPKGSIIIANTWALTRAERYVDPEAFNPDRFLNKDGSLNDDNVDYAFGFGRRNCPGRHVARATLWLSIATTLWAFNISKAKDADGNEIPVNVEYTDALVSHPTGPHPCSITPRLPQTKEIIEEAAARTRERT